MGSKYLKTGDVVRTNPFKDFWIASVVFATQEKTDHFRKASLLGTTNAVFRHPFVFEEIDQSDWDLVRSVGGFSSGNLLLETYYSLIKPGVEVIGNIDPRVVSDREYRLEFSPESLPPWPIRGALDFSLGMSGIHTWRKENDYENWLVDLEEARASHEAMLERLKKKKQNKANQSLHSTSLRAVSEL